MPSRHHHVDRPRRGHVRAWFITLATLAAFATPLAANADPNPATSATRTATTSAAGRPAAGAHDVRRAARSSHAPLTWAGYRGVRPGEPLSRAARHLGVRVKAVCSFRLLTGLPPGVTIDDGAGRPGRVNELIVSSRSVRAPAGLRVGMTFAKARAVVGARLRRHLNTDAQVYDYYLAGPHGRVTWFRLGRYVAATGIYYPQQIALVSLTANKTAAFHAMSVEGC